MMMVSGSVAVTMTSGGGRCWGLVLIWRTEGVHFVVGLATSHSGQAHLGQLLHHTQRFQFLLGVYDALVQILKEERTFVLVVGRFVLDCIPHLGHVLVDLLHPAILGYFIVPIEGCLHQLPLLALLGLTVRLSHL